MAFNNADPDDDPRFQCCCCNVESFVFVLAIVCCILNAFSFGSSLARGLVMYSLFAFVNLLGNMMIITAHFTHDSWLYILPIILTGVEIGVYGVALFSIVVALPMGHNVHKEIASFYHWLLRHMGFAFDMFDHQMQYATVLVVSMIISVSFVLFLVVWWEIALLRCRDLAKLRKDHLLVVNQERVPVSNSYQGPVPMYNVYQEPVPMYDAYQ